MLLISATLLYLSTIPSCRSAVGEETGEPETSLRWKLFCYSSKKSPNAKNFCFSFCFMSFVFISWPIETTTANLQGLTHSNLSKSTNQVTLTNGHMNHLFWAYGNLVHYHINPYFLLFLFSWPEEGRACLIAQRQ